MKEPPMHLTVLVTAILLWCGSLVSAPRLTIDNGEFDFGFAPQQSKISHTFWLKSTGDEDLQVTKVIPGCGCAKAPLEKDIISPGDSTRLEIVFSTRTYRNRVQKRPTIVTNETGANHHVRIAAHVVIRPDSTYPILITPFPVSLDGNSTDPDEAVELQITNVSDEALDLSVVACPEDYLTMDMPEDIRAGETVAATLTVPDAARDESFEKSVTIELNDNMSLRFTIPVKYTAPTAKETGISSRPLGN